LKRKLVIHAHQFSAQARRKIEAAGGTAAVIEVPAPIRPKTKRAKNQPKPVAPVTVETEPSAAEGDATPAKGSKKAKAEKGAKAERGEKAERGAKAERGEKAEKGGKGARGQAESASGTEDSVKPDKGKKKS